MWCERHLAARRLVAVLSAALLSAALPSVHAASKVDALTRRGFSNPIEVAALHMPGDTVGIPKVQIGFYSESLCPFCRAFTNDTLAPIMDSELADVVQLNYFPYGNARLNSGTGKVECQHGEEECRLNKVFACLLHIYPRQKQWFPFVHCVENKSPAEMEESLEKCSLVPLPPLNIAEIRECAAGSMGRKLERELGLKTARLKPPHRWVPWLTVNGVPLWDDNENLEQYICAAYQGKRPDRCFRSKTVSTTRKINMNPAPSAVCMRDE